MLEYCMGAVQLHLRYYIWTYQYVMCPVSLAHRTAHATETTPSLKHSAHSSQLSSSAVAYDTITGSSAGGFLSSLLADVYKPKVPGVGEMRHGTEGWRCLETSMRGMVAVLVGLGPGALPFLTHDVLRLVTR